MEAGSTFGVFLVLTSYYKSGHAALDQRRVRVAQSRIVVWTARRTLVVILGVPAT